MRERVDWGFCRGNAINCCWHSLPEESNVMWLASKWPLDTRIRACGEYPVRTSIHHPTELIQPNSLWDNRVKDAVKWTGIHQLLSTVGETVNGGKEKFIYLIMNPFHKLGYSVGAGGARARWIMNPLLKSFSLPDLEGIWLTYPSLPIQW